jgi:hypothetical protein
MKTFFIVSLLLNLTKVYATSVRVGIENITPNVGGYQINDLGGSEYFSFNPGLRVETKTTLYSMTTHIGASIFLPSTSEDSLYDTTYVKVDTRYRFYSQDRLQLFLGLALYSKIISGTGENLTLQNGNSTSSFYGPSQTKFNYFFSPEFSTRFFFNTKVASTVTLSVQDISEKERLSWNYLIDVTWKLF